MDNASIFQIEGLFQKFIFVPSVLKRLICAMVVLESHQETREIYPLLLLLINLLDHFVDKRRD